MSTLTSPHIIAGDFNAALYSFLKQREAFVPRIYLDGKGIPTLGVGYALAVRNETTKLYELRSAPELTQQMGAMGITLTQADKDILNAAVGALNGQAVPPGVPTIEHWPGSNNTPFSFGTITEPQFQPLFNLLVDDFTTKLIAKIGQPVFSALAGANEMVALLSLTFNSPSLIGPKLIDALQTGNRAEAWYEIRYQSNKERQTDPLLAGGIANRRYAESDRFGLYDNAALTPDEAKSVFRMYTIHRDAIHVYESDPLVAPGATDTFASKSSDARNKLVDVYASFAGAPTIGGEVLVGQDEVLPGGRLDGTALNDLMFGEKGHDILKGDAGDDVLYGGEGTDQLTGGTGNDYLDGGAGYDTYIYRINDGQDIISDSDGKGSIFYDGKLVVGGQRQAGSTGVYTSLDGTFTFLQSGADLIINNLLTIKNYTPGQNGITLRELSTIATAAPPTFRTIVGDFQPLDIDLVEAGIQIGYDDLGNVIQDPQSPGDRSDLLNGSENNDQMNGGALRDRLTALGGSDVLTGGSDGDVLIGQDGNDQLFADELVTVSSLVSFENFGGTVGTGANGDFLTGGINDDVLVSGAGNDALYGGTGKDLILGGAGNDVIDGDSDVVATDFGWSYTFTGPLSYTLVNSVQLSDGTVIGDDDALYGGAGNDVIFGKKGKDLLYGEAGDDTMTGGDGDDVVLGGVGNDSVFGDDIGTAGNDYVDGGDGDDVVVGAFGDDTVIGGLGNDILYGEAANLPGIVGNDILDGGDGNDELNGTGGSDVLFGGAGNDVLRGDFLGDPVPGDDFLYGDAGNDILRGEAGNDALDGGDGDDELQGNQGSDVLSGGTGVDTMFGQEGEDTLFGDEGNDFLYGDSNGLDPGIGANDVLDGGEGNDQLLGDGGDDQLFGGTGNDILLGDTDLAPLIAGADWLFGEEGDDQLYGGAGNDVLEGGVGNDSLSGGGGSDTYQFHLGDGTDTIEDAIGQGNRLVFGQGIGSESVTLGVGTGDTLIVRVGNAGDAVRITGFSVNNPEAFHPIDSFEFADGTALTYSQLVERGFQLFGTSSDESLVGTGFADRIAAGSGNDVVYGLVGADTLLGEDGADVLRGGAGDDILDGGAGNDQLRGEDGVDVLYGGAGDDLLTADVGPDRLVGGAGNDLYELFGSGDVIVEAAGEGIDTVRVGVPGSFVLPDEVENIELREDTFFPSAGDQFIGNALNNRMTGGTLLDGRQGNDTLIGLGDNIYVFGRGYGQDVIQTGIQGYVTPNFVDYIQVLAGVAPTDVMLEGQGDHLVMKIAGTADQVTVENYLLGISPTVGEIHFADGTIWDGTEITNRLRVLTGTNGNDTLRGLNSDNDLFGLGGDDQLYGLDGNDRLDGGTGADGMVGGQGNDTYVVDNVSDTVTESLNEGTDLVESSVTYTLSANVENLTLTGTAVINGTGNGLNNVLTGNSAANALAGGAGNDTYVIDTGDTVTEAASAGTDTVQSTVTFTLGANIENLTLLGTAAINGTGNTLNNTLVGNSGANILNGGTGADSLRGGAGNDTYVVDNVSDTVMENLNEGTDLVQSSVTYTLGANVENLTLTGTTAINGTGNTLDNVLTGNSAANVLTGGAGNDTYVVGTGDTVTEAAGAGTDTVQSSVTFTLGTNVENLTLTGITAINGTGNTLNNVLIGNSGANTLSGGTGADSMSGGAGDDTYAVDNVSDTATENLNEGTDLVQSSVTYTLGANVENLTLTGTTAINGTGNTLDNVLTGNSAANVLTGGAGNDTYVVTTGDTVTEAAGAGTDTVQSSVTWTLGANVENLTLTGTTAINGTGNTLDNVLTGNSGANVLTGGAGNDTYVVGTGDTVTEQASAGTDTVQSAITWTLGTNLENLTLTGTTAINGTGNTLDNILTGNSGANVLTGGAGNDTYVVGTGDSVVENAGGGTDTVQSAITWTLGTNLENLMLIGTAAINGTGNASNNTLAGNSGNNVLTGLGGNDIYQYSRGGGQDTVVDNSGTSDTMQFGVTINPLDLVISRQANDLRLTIHGSTDQMTIQNWYSGATNQAETIQAGNGQTLLSTQVDQLIQAMAGFTQQTGLTWDQAIDQQPTQVQTVLAASWQ
jgi:Ca2+-binding RTX toxin-like protein